MPYITEWEPNEIALEHKGVKLYHVYKEDDANEGPRTYFFGLTDDASDEGGPSFDVRDLPNWKHDPTPSNVYGIDGDAHILAIMREAIDLGHITQGEVLLKDGSKEVAE